MLCIVFLASISISWSVAEVSLSLLTATLLVSLCPVPRAYMCMMLNMVVTQADSWTWDGPSGCITPLGTYSLFSDPPSKLLTDPAGQLRVPKPVAGILFTIFRKTDSTERQTDNGPST